MAGIQDLARVGEFEFEEVQEFELKFSEDLERVFEGKQDDFGDHLRGMLFELWSRARGTKSDIVLELEELRQLASEKKDLEALIADGIKAQLPVIAEQFKSTFEGVMVAGIQTHLHNELEFPTSGGMFDDALAAALTRVINPGDGLETVKEYGKITIKADGSSFPEFTTNDPEELTQVRLRKRLQFEGLLPADDHQDSWKWAPVFMHTDSGERAAFHLWNWRERHDPDPQEIRVSLAWDGVHWCFPNPRPRGKHNDILHLVNILTILINGVEQDSSSFHGLFWHWETFDGESCVTKVQCLPAYEGTEIVEARYRVVEKYTAS